MDLNNEENVLSPIEDARKELEDITEPIREQKAELDNVLGDVKSLNITSIAPSIWQSTPSLTSAMSTMGKIADIIPKISNVGLQALQLYQSTAQLAFPLVSKMYAWNQAINESALNSIKRIYDSIKPIQLPPVISPALQWLTSLNLTPIYDCLKALNLASEYAEYYEALEAEYRNTMFACKWFPYAGWTVDAEILDDVSYILATSRNKAENKRREKRIDEVVFKYYTKKEIKVIKSRWYHSDLKPHVKKILGQAIEAHLRGEYVLTTTCLATMWEGIIRDKLNVQRISQKKTAEGLKELSAINNFDAIYADFYNQLILCDCSGPEDVVEGIPNRNAIGHSQYKKYPNKKSSLNAILITDFLINLKTEIPAKGV